MVLLRRAYSDSTFYDPTESETQPIARPLLRAYLDCAVSSLFVVFLLMFGSECDPYAAPRDHPAKADRIRDQGVDLSLSL